MFRRIAFAVGCAFMLGSQAHAQATPTPNDPTFTQTRFPIVLAEGLAGINFFQVAEQLRAGGAQVFLTSVDTMNDSRVRGPQLIAQIESILAMTGATKVNLIGHSQGGLDARFILGTRPELLASITQAGTPNLGSPIATTLMGTGLGALLPIFTSLIGGDGQGTDVEAALRFLSAQGATQFNQEFPLGLPTSDCGSGPATAAGVALFSFGGTTPSTNFFDLSDFFLGFLGIFAGAPPFAGMPNDGLVARCSTHFGSVLRDDFVMNHIDLLNQVNGAIGADNPIAVYRMQANRLKAMGL